MAQFIWKVAVQGYDWADYYNLAAPGAESTAEYRYTGLILVPVEWKFSTYQPLKAYTGLFSSFASTPKTREGIRAFANRYGHLGEGGSPWNWGPSKGKDFEYHEESKKERKWYESLAVPQSWEDWNLAISRMKKAVELWDHVRDGDLNAKDLRKLQKTVDDHLNELRVTARFEITEPPRYQPALHIVPTTLCGAMWLQFAQAIVGDKKYRACATCRQSFELSPKTARTSRHYCSDACRSHAYRNRMARARQLWVDGKTVRQIADELGTKDKKKIEDWLAKESMKPRRSQRRG